MAKRPRPFWPSPPALFLGAARRRHPSWSPRYFRCRLPSHLAKQWPPCPPCPARPRLRPTHRQASPTTGHGWPAHSAGCIPSLLVWASIAADCAQSSATATSAEIAASSPHPYKTHTHHHHHPAPHHPPPHGPQAPPACFPPPTSPPSWPAAAPAPPPAAAAQCRRGRLAAGPAQTPASCSLSGAPCSWSLCTAFLRLQQGHVQSGACACGAAWRSRAECCARGSTAWWPHLTPSPPTQLRLPPVIAPCSLCYVSEPARCATSLQSTRYPGAAWKLC